MATGLVAPDNVNIMCVRSCGESVVKKNERTSPFAFTFQKIMQAVQISFLSSILGKKTDDTRITTSFLKAYLGLFR